jgi:hypothetical protein
MLDVQFTNFISLITIFICREAEAMISVSSFIAVESHSPMKRLTHDRFCEVKETFPFGQVPVLTIDGKNVIPQEGAI